MRSAAREHDRLAALHACAVMDTPREPAFDRLVFTTAQLLRVPLAMLVLIDEDRVWAKAKIGPLAGEWTPRMSFCQTLIDLDEPLVVGDTLDDPRFAALPIVASDPRVRFYVGVPLIGPGRHVIGGLCAMDRIPRSIPDTQLNQFAQLGREASELLRLRVPNLDVSE